MSSVDTAFSHNFNRVPYDSDDQDGNRLSCLDFIVQNKRSISSIFHSSLSSTTS